MPELGLSGQVGKIEHRSWLMGGGLAPVSHGGAGVRPGSARWLYPTATARARGLQRAARARRDGRGSANAPTLRMGEFQPVANRFKWDARSWTSGLVIMSGREVLVSQAHLRRFGRSTGPHGAPWASPMVGGPRLRISLPAPSRSPRHPLRGCWSRCVRRRGRRGHRACAGSGAGSRSR